MALKKILTLRRSRSDRLEVRRLLVQPSFRPDGCGQSRLWGMVSLFRGCHGVLDRTTDGVDS
jgi:hypothetical protein